MFNWKFNHLHTGYQQNEDDMHCVDNTTFGIRCYQNAKIFQKLVGFVRKSNAKPIGRKKRINLFIICSMTYFLISFLLVSSTLYILKKDAS